MKALLMKKGLVPYLEGKELQLKAVEAVKSGLADMILITLQHPPVYTIGRAGGYENLLVPLEELRKIAEVHEVERGGNITFHGPGQIVAYPVVNLNRWEKDVHLFVDRLEEAVIRLLAGYGVRAGRKPEYTGVWVGDEKICAIGIAVKRWITWHGIAFNVNTDLTYFGRIFPCGIREFGVTSLEKLGIKEDPERVREKLIGKFEEVFGVRFEEIDENRLESMAGGLHDE
ncbi:lipoyl(octanoyl) transferase LipB [Thermosediminibacter litoriperuensis]|uniref:Octanoyltransferase n=1 Tax=Thermosediminibacter litoriperuensis TaxID=291989 RepID=A0A5S5AXD4_9FIRM|nr:lipoyl(octanoyl) transferase LipB [Thermosediminibacter litoriperuensis]TYP56120.1 lipoyl(octanoyl) transferase [Thermosediminibacter litoriperuensis]